MNRNYKSSKDWNFIPFSKILYLALLTIVFICIFLIGKVAFMLYNIAEETFDASDVIDVLRHGLSMDASTSGYLIAIPWIFCIVAVWWKKMPFRKILIPYFIIIATLLIAIIGGDAYLYEFWKFKLNSAIFAYFQNADEATNSVSLGFIISRVIAIVICVAVVAYILIRITPKNFKESTHRIINTVAMIFVGCLIFVMIRGGVQESTMNVGVAYYSPKLFLNHSAVNPAFSLLSSISRSENFAKQFNYLVEEERAEAFDGLYPTETNDIQDTLLTTQRPNVLVVLMESFGGKFIEELGGIPGVSPNISRLIKEGVFFDNYYANSFRTDRGTVCVYSGFVSYPTTSLMRLPQHNGHLPAIGLTLRDAGYSTTYLYGGDIKIMGKRGYLVSAGYDNFISDVDFSQAEINESKWGANDSLTSMKTFHYLMSLPKDKPWHMSFQTLSSHEPFEVPYQRLEDKKLNAFAYTDQCVGDLVDSLKSSPLWDNTLVILMPDHGFLYDLSYEDPDFFHCPLLWLGGVIKEPKYIHTLMNQSDFAATLLAQMGLPHDDFFWSRNVLSENYTYPFAYSTFPSGIMFKDSTGVTVYDITSKKPIVEQPESSEDRLNKAKAILQTSYDKLEEQR